MRNSILSLPCRAAPLLMVVLLTVAALAHAQTVIVEVPNFQGGAFFGQAVTTLDGNRFIVSAPGIDEGANDDVGRVYLFNPAGGLLTTITNPVPTQFAFFGASVAGMTSNRVIVGASDADRGGFFYVGEAYLFATNGTRLQTFVNPVVEDNSYFGVAVCAVGSNRILIGAPGTAAGTTLGVGRAYLFSTNGGAPVRTFTNPIPNLNANFGAAVAALGNDRVVIGAFQQDFGSGPVSPGAAYVFHTNGTLLAALTNPVPSDNAAFGHALTILGTDRIVVGAFGTTRAGFDDSGEAYLLSTNGTLLAIMTNPTPALLADFGGAVAIYDQDKILVSADRAGTPIAGAAYLYSTNGVRLATFTNPANGSLDLFGWAMAPVSSNVMAITANQYTVPVPSNSFVGRTYLVTMPVLPDTNISLSITASSDFANLSWFTTARTILQESTNLTAPVPWSDSSITVSTNGVTNTAAVPISSSPTLRAFRLRSP